MTVSEQIIQVINALCEKFGIAINWTSENVIPYVEVLCKKLVVYEIWTSIAWIIFMIGLAITSIIATKKLVPIIKKGLAEYFNELWITAAVVGSIALGIIGLIVIIGVIAEVGDIIKCLTFPEMYVFEYVSRLIQQ